MIMKTPKLLLLLICFCPTLAFSQEELFKDAIRRGKNTSGYYTAISGNKDRFTLPEFQTVAREKGYILNIDDYQKKTINRFGNVYDIVASIDFFLPDDFPLYAYCHLAKTLGISDATTDDLKVSGSAYLFYDDKQKHIDPDEGKLFTRFSSVQWSGKVNDTGKIAGTGRGFLMNDDWLCCFKGTFVNGYPVGKADFTWVNWKNNSRTFFHKDGSYPIDKGWSKVNPELCSIDNIDPADCLRDLKSFLNTGKVPSLSKKIYGHLGALPARYVFFYPDEEAEKMRFALGPMARAGIKEAEEALDFMTVYDAWNLAATKEYNDRAKESIFSGTSIEKFKDANYWTTLASAEQTIKSLKTIAPEYTNKLNQVDGLITEWNRTIFACREEAMKKRGEAIQALRSNFYDMLKSAVTSASSSSSSSSPSRESCRVHLVKKDGSNYANEEFCAGHKGFLGATWVDTFTTDGDGYATIFWEASEDDPNYITNTIGQEFSLFHINFKVEDLDMINGGSYTICVDCN